QGWSDAPIALSALNYLDAQVKISAAQIDWADAQFAPAAIEATLAGGVLKASVSNLGAYGGQATGEVIVDASTGNPTYQMHCDLVGVRALPLLTSLAAFDKLDGKMQAKIAARSAGAQPARDHVEHGRHRLRAVPGRRDPWRQHRADDPLPDREHAERLAGA